MSIPRYIINWDEVVKELSKGVNIEDVSVDVSGIELVLETCFPEMIDLLEAILDEVKFIKTEYKGYEQRMLGFSRKTVKDVETFEFIPENDIYLTGLSFSHNHIEGIDDYYNLSVVNGNAELIFAEVPSKDALQHKCFNVFFPVPKGLKVRITHYNKSNKKKRIWYDLEYLERCKQVIDHNYDWMVVMRWEDNANTDLDLHCYFDCDPNKHIYYSSKELEIGKDNKTWLDYDYTSHSKNGREKEPEILTILGMENNVANLYIVNFDRGKITENVTIEIYKRKGITDEKVKEIVYEPSKLTGEKVVYIGNIKDGKFIEKGQNVPYNKDPVNSFCDI